MILSRRQWHAVRLCTQGREVRNRDLRDTWGVGAETIRQDLAGLVDAGILVRHGAARGSYYTAGDLGILRERNARTAEPTITQGV